MRPSVELFNIIKSLSKSEKRYFKLFASLQEGDKNYLKLFDAIDEMAAYNEEYIKKIFSKEKFIRQLTFTKNYLYNLIFKSLYRYTSSDSVESRLNDLIFRCNFFYKKALYREFKNSIDTGKKLAVDYERFGYFLQFVSLEKLSITDVYHPLSADKPILDQEELIIEKISNLSVYDSYVSMITGIYREEGRTREDVLFKYIERIKKSPLLISEDYALSILAKERYYYLLQLIADIYGDFEQMYKICSKRLDMVLSNPKPFSDRTFNYWQDILMNLILFSIRNNKSQNLIDYLHLLEKHSTNSLSDKIYIFLVQAILSVNLIINEKRWDKINVLMERVELGLEIYKNKFDSNYLIVLYDAVSRMFVEAGKYLDALKYINLLLNHPFISARRDIEYNARLLNLIIHFELQNYDYLEYLIISTYRFLYKRKKVYKLETLVLNFIRRLTKIQTDDDLKENFELLRKDLTAIYNLPHEKNIFLYFDYLNWVNKKISAA